jgi:hypothetical protein
MPNLRLHPDTRSRFEKSILGICGAAAVALDVRVRDMPLTAEAITKAALA